MTDDRYSFLMDGADTAAWDGLQEFEWVEVRGPRLESPILLRFAKTADDRFVVNGLIIGGAWPRPEITANTLRSIPIGAIVKQLWDDFDLTNPPDYGDLDASITWGLMQQFGAGQDWLPVPSRIGARSADDGDLVGFSKVYLEERAKNAHRAMTATAQRLNISRATANRRAAACRAKGLLQ